MILSVSNIHKSFGEGSLAVHVLKGIDLSVCKGSFNILKGRSGSGKTTLLNIIGTLDNPDSGTIRFNNQTISFTSEQKKDQLRRKSIGFIYQSVALFPVMTAAENIDLSLRIAGFDHYDRKERVANYLNKVGLYSRRNHFPFQMSGGEQQRIAIVRAIAHSPQILLADEPTAELDSSSAVHVVKIFRQIIEDDNLSVIMTTHDPGMLEIADNIYEMEDGRIMNNE